MSRMSRMLVANRFCRSPHALYALLMGAVTLLCVGVLGFAAPPGATAAELDASARVDFARDVQPIFKAHCMSCHGEKKKGGLRLDNRRDAFTPADSGEQVIHPGKTAESLLIEVLTTDDDDLRMPPPGKAGGKDNKPLSKDQIALLTRWVKQGAVWPEDAGATQQHWAYVKPQRPDLPAVRDRGWPRGAIDRFVLAKLESEGLKPSPQATKARLLRRVYLDVIGLPPTVEEADAFLADTSADAYEKVVDRLLASPRFGEHWSRQWLDLARYADSNGFQADQIRDNWAFRDWVIKALNADMPFDQFSIEQLAGDLLPNATVQQKVATGFHRLTTCNVEAGVHPEENRHNQVFDRVNTTGTVWLGTTMECAQCHNHKYDPFSMKDYYQLFAYFNNTPIEVRSPTGKGVSFDFYGPKMELPLSPEQEAKRKQVSQKLAAAKAELQRVEKVAIARMSQWEASALKGAKANAQWHTLKVSKFTSTGGASHELLSDGSVLISGKFPDKDTYIIEAETAVKDITGFKLEALTHKSLPSNGPGRHAAPRPNFVLYAFDVKAGALDESGNFELAEGRGLSPVKLHAAKADFSQQNWHVGGLLDGKNDTGWAINPQFGKDHEASFLTRQPVRHAHGTKLVFTLPQHYGACRTLGRFRLSVMTGQRDASALPGAIAKILRKTKRSKKETRQLRDHYLKQYPDHPALTEQIAKLEKELGAVKPATTLVMVEMDKPRATHILRRGEYLNKGPRVDMGVPASLHDKHGDLPKNRLGFAKWLMSKDNPLTARVIVNRWWAQLFGHGIVKTQEDFGTMGDKPTHPELLDWLAVEFMEGRQATSKSLHRQPAPKPWSMKHVLKLMVMSAAYQQSARVTPELLEKDPENRLLARGPRLRMSAEMIRDNALRIAGVLSTKMYGEPVMPYQPPGLWRQTGRNEPKWKEAKNEDRFRRGVYIIYRRAAPYPSFVNFDGPDRAACTPYRSRTNTPLQALTLLNDPAYVEAAMIFAAHVMKQTPKASVEERIDYAFRAALTREPTTLERGHLVALYKRERARIAADPDSADKLVGQTLSRLRGAWDLPEPVNKQTHDLAAWFYVTNVLLNLDETITKG